jgi:hypothetical protein
LKKINYILVCGNIPQAVSCRGIKGELLEIEIEFMPVKINDKRQATALVTTLSSRKIRFGNKEIA